MAGSLASSSPVAAVNTLFVVEPKLLEDNPEVLLCCVDRETFSIRFSGVSCLEIMARRCHIAVPGDPPNVRRLCLLPGRDVNNFAQVSSPVNIRVKSSSTIQFNCTEDVSKREVRGTLLWEIEMLSVRAASNLRPVGAVPDDLPHEMDLQPVDPSPDLDQCNCKKSIQSPPIIVNMNPDIQPGPDPPTSTLQNFQLSDDESDQESDQQDEQDGNTDTEDPDESTQTLSGQIFSVAGTSWQTYYQDALDQCAKVRREGNDVATRAVFEPTNVKDKNAIKFEVFVESSWQIVGYCPGSKVPKLTRAIKKDDVTEISLHKLTLYYSPPAKKTLYRAYLKIVKKGTWERDCMSYTYNSVIVT